MRNLLWKVAILCIAVAFPARAHDPHTHLADALSSARSPKGGLCCDGKDYTIPADWRGSPEEGYRVLIGKAWINVPKEALVTNMKNPDMEAKVWLYHADGEVAIRCFMPGIEV